MGGTGSGSGIPPSGETSGFDCANVSITTYLNSPNPSVLKKITVGITLTIDLDPKTGALVAIHKKTIAGSITHSNVVDLIECMNEGYSYQAKVISLDGGSCQIRITNV
jgi:hypothetical protein